MTRRHSKTLHVRTLIRSSFTDHTANVSSRGPDGLPDLEMVSSLVEDVPERTQWLTRYSVELSLSIIVGCLPTLRPLFDSNHWTKKSSRGYTDDSYALNKSGSRPQETIQKTTEIQVQSREFGSRTGSSEGDDAWEPREHV